MVCLCDQTEDQCCIAQLTLNNEGTVIEPYQKHMPKTTCNIKTHAKIATQIVTHYISLNAFQRVRPLHAVFIASKPLNIHFALPTLTSSDTKFMEGGALGPAAGECDSTATARSRRGPRTHMK